MAFYRSISRDFFTNEDVVGLSPMARLLYIATWLEADREGRLVWRPKTLKLRFLPGDECDINKLAGELVYAGLIIPYTIGGVEYAEIPTFTNDQNINNREAASTIPERDQYATTTSDARVNDASATRDDATTTPLVVVESSGVESIVTRRVASRADTVLFERFWSAYPRHVAKAMALKAWQKQNPDLDVCLAAVERERATDQWKKEDGAFIPHPATWLNQRRWEDEPDLLLNTGGKPDWMAGAL